MTPFWVNYHCHLVMKFQAPKNPCSLNSTIHADTFAASLKVTHQTLSKNLQDAEANQTKYIDGKEVVLEIGDTVWHSMRHFRLTRLSKKSDYIQTGQYTASKFINQNAYIIQLPYTSWNNNIVNISLLDRYTPPTAAQMPSEPQPMVVDDSD